MSGSVGRSWGKLALRGACLLAIAATVKYGLLEKALLGPQPARAVTAAEFNAEVHDRLVQISSTLRQQLPMQVDAVTRLVDIHVDEKNLELIYEVSTPFTQADVSSYLGTMRPQLCSGPLAKFVGLGVAVTYSYRAPGVRLNTGSFTVTSCDS